MFGGGSSGDSHALQPPRPKPELDKEELTTKGRKRKRLAKACSACHVSIFFSPLMIVFFFY